MVSLTKQDLQNALDVARNRLLERVATRQDVNSLRETIKVLTVTLQQSQQLLRQEEYQRVQLVRRAVAMESRMVGLENELRQVRTSMVQLAHAQPVERMTERVILQQVQADPEHRQTPEQRYYNPSPVT
ncbi:MAG TPA: hypothetical protein VK694_01720 [Verrucomicrobiae bacterium]|nr:hypothetical protein [Verrucomicrobiae bacterium]